MRCGERLARCLMFCAVIHWILDCLSRLGCSGVVPGSFGGRSIVVRGRSGIVRQNLYEKNMKKYIFNRTNFLIDVWGYLNIGSHDGPCKVAHGRL